MYKYKYMYMYMCEVLFTRVHVHMYNVVPHHTHAHCHVHVGVSMQGKHKRNLINGVKYKVWQTTRLLLCLGCHGFPEGTLPLSTSCWSVLCANSTEVNCWNNVRKQTRVNQQSTHTHTCRHTQRTCTCMTKLD